MDKKTLIDSINNLKEDLSQKRDQLQDLIYDATDLLDSNERAMYSLEEAVDALSELV